MFIGNLECCTIHTFAWKGRPHHYHSVQSVLAQPIAFLALHVRHDGETSFCLGVWMGQSHDTRCKLWQLREDLSSSEVIQTVDLGPCFFNRHRQQLSSGWPIDLRGNGAPFDSDSVDVNVQFFFLENFEKTWILNLAVKTRFCFIERLTTYSIYLEVGSQKGQFWQLLFTRFGRQQNFWVQKAISSKMRPVGSLTCISTAALE